MHQQDTTDAETLTAYLGKYSMDFGDSARVKLLKRIHLQGAPGYGKLFVRAGGQMTPHDSIAWCTEVEINDPTQIADCFATGRYISVEIKSTGSDVWKLTGLDLEVEPRGYF